MLSARSYKGLLAGNHSCRDLNKATATVFPAERGGVLDETLTSGPGRHDQALDVILGQTLKHLSDHIYLLICKVDNAILDLDSWEYFIRMHLQIFFFF